MNNLAEVNIGSDLHMVSTDNNFVGINNVIQLNKVSDCPSNLGLAIEMFVNDQNMANTKTAYTTDILQFFGVSSFDMVTDGMVSEISTQKARQYFNGLADKYQSSTISRKIACIKALFNYIWNDGVKGSNGEYLLSRNPIANIKINSSSNEYGSFTAEEVNKILDIAAEEDSVFYNLLVKTGVRKESIRNLRVNNFECIDGMWCVRGFDKAKKGVPSEYVKACGEELYNRCMELVGRVGDSEVNPKIFSFGANTPLNRLRGCNGNYSGGYCFRIGISEDEYSDRNLCLHSFKKTGIQMVTDKSNGNLKLIMQQGSHSAEYAMGTYQKKVYNPYDDPSNLVKLGNGEFDEELDTRLREMSGYELRELIMSLSEMGDGFKKAITGLVG